MTTRSRLVQQVLDWLTHQEPDLYLVGGCVRDRLLGRPLHDLDLTTSGDGLRLARRLANRFEGAYYPLDVERNTGRAILTGAEGDLVVDVAHLRGDSLAADLAARDFTINALAAPVRAPAQVIDFHGGLPDLEARLIRPVSDRSLRDDPLRALRAVRLAAELGFALSPETEALIARDGAALARVAGERVRDEFTRLLARPQAAPWLRRLDALGLLTIILPDLEPLRGLEQPPPHHLPVLAHSLETVHALESLFGAQPPPVPFPLPQLPTARRVILKLAALLHDTGKASTRTVDEIGRIRFIGHAKIGARITAQALRRLRLSRTEVRLGETIVRHHMRPLLLANQQSVSARAVYRFFRDTGDAGVEVLIHALADHRATHSPAVPDDRWPRLVALTERMLRDYEEHRERITPPPLINGHDLLREFGLQPGPHIGEILEAVREAQVSGEVRSREAALALVRRLTGHTGEVSSRTKQ